MKSCQQTEQKKRKFPGFSVGRCTYSTAYYKLVASGRGRGLLARMPCEGYQACAKCPLFVKEYRGTLDIDNPELPVAPDERSAEDDLHEKLLLATIRGNRLARALRDVAEVLDEDERTDEEKISAIHIIIESETENGTSAIQF